VGPDMAPRTRRSFATVVVALATVALFAMPAHAGIADRAGATFVLMSEDFVKAFLPLDTLVVQVDGETVYLDAGEGTSAQVGQELLVYRKGEIFTHPVTGKPLGRYEELLGHAQIRRVHLRYSEATFIAIPGKPRPAPEDGARITRGRIRVAVTPVINLSGAAADVRRVPYMIATTLERSKRFQVVDPLAVSDMLVSSSVRVEEVLARPERATRAATTLEVSGWLVPILIERRGVTYLDVTWISAVSGTALFSRRQPLVAPGSVEDQRFPWEPRPED
jgi:hypothetical protein